MLTFQVLCLVASVTGLPEQPAINVVQVPGDISNQNSTLVRGVSGDGRVVVGQSFHNVVSNRQSALIWTQPNGSNSFAAADATAVNYDGTVVVGRKRVSAEGAYRWSSSGGFVTLPDFDGQTKSTALGVSGDGNYTIGYAQYDTVTLRHIRVARWDAQGGLIFESATPDPCLAPSTSMEARTPTTRRNGAVCAHTFTPDTISTDSPSSMAGPIRPSWT